MSVCPNSLWTHICDEHCRDEDGTCPLTGRQDTTYADDYIRAANLSSPGDLMHGPAATAHKRRRATTNVVIEK